MRQEFNTVDFVRLEVETATEGLSNLVQNPSGELGGWGWVTPLSSSSIIKDPLSPSLKYERTVAGASYYYTEPMPLAAGQYVAATYRIDGSNCYQAARFEYLDANMAVLSASPQTAISGSNATFNVDPALAPALTTFVRLRFDLYGNIGGAAPGGGQSILFSQVTVAKAATSGDLGIVRANLIPNPSLETDAAGWRSGPTSTIVRSTAQAAVGSASLLLTAGETVVDQYVSTIEGSGGFPVVAGTTYSLQFRSRAATTGRSWNTRVYWYDSNGETISFAADVTISNVAGSWTTYNRTVTAPSGATYAGIRVASGGAVAAGEQHYFDAFHFEATSSIASYFDGATTDSGGVFYDWSAQAPKVKNRTNLVTNPSFETNTTGWEGNGDTIARVTSPAGVVGSACLQVTGVTTSGPRQSAPSWMPVTPGLRYQASLYARSAAVSVSCNLLIDWLNSGGGLISTTTPAWLSKTSTTEWRRFSVSGIAPSGATHARIRVPLAAGGEVHYIDAVLFEQSDWLRGYFDGSTGVTPDSWTGVASRAWTGTAHASTSTQTDTNTLPYSAASTSNLPFIEPVSYFDILPESHQIRVVRGELNAGRLAATVLSSSLDPSQSDLIRPGRRARLSCLVDGSWETLLGGKLLEADVTYELKDPRIPESKRARIEVVVIDPAQTLANAGRPEGVATINELPFVLEGAGVPWSVNGSGNQVSSANVTTYNDSAKALDQVALTRDTALGFAWMSRVGVLNVWDRSLIASGSPVLLNESDYSGLDLSFSTKDAINELQITVQALGTDGTTTETVYGPFVDVPSIEEWGRYRKEFTVTGLDSAAVEALAAEILAANVKPRIRVNSITIPLRTVERLETHALRDLYDEVNTVLDELDVDDVLRVTGIEHTIDTGKWMLTLRFSEEGGVAQPTVQPPVQSGARPDVGVIELFAGTTPPPGKLLCDGASYAVADYPFLHAVIGYSFGGAGAFFNVPDLTDRFPIGAGTKALGTSGGSPTVTLTAANVPAHTHPIARQDGAYAGGGGGTNVALGNAVDGPAGATGVNAGTATPVDVLNPWLSIWFVIRAA